MSDYQYLSIKQIAENNQYPFSLGQIRHYLIMRHKNGLDIAIRKIGKRLFLRKDLFDQWIENQGNRRDGGTVNSIATDFHERKKNGCKR